MPEEMVSVFEEEGMPTPSKESFLSALKHWIVPGLAALVSSAVLAGYLITAGTYAQRLSNVESNYNKLDNTTVKKTEIEYHLNSIDNSLGRIEGKVDKMQERRR